ncbi:MAG: flagellar motor switch protein FliN [Gammaproteobacteria bacterium]
MSENDELSDEWAAAMNEQAEGEADRADAAKSPQAASRTASGYAAAEFPNLEEHKASDRPNSAEVKLDVILDVPVTISLEIGRTKINIRNLLQLNQGSVVELDRFAGEPMDVLVNGTLVAHGEVVVVNDKFGIRLTDIISPSERVRKLA